jgi:thiamine transporter ThiT
MLKTKKVDSKRFLFFVLVAYFMTFFFSYTFFMVSGPLITGQAMMNLNSDSNLSQVAFGKTVALMSWICIVVLLILLVCIIYLNQIKKNSKKGRIYRALNIKSH